MKPNKTTHYRTAHFYFVETEKGNYNAVDGQDHFEHTVRPNCHDDSPIVHVWKWASGGWIEVDWQ